MATKTVQGHCNGRRFFFYKYTYSGYSVTLRCRTTSASSRIVSGRFQPSTRHRKIRASFFLVFFFSLEKACLNNVLKGGLRVCDVVILLEMMPKSMNTNRLIIKSTNWSSYHLTHYLNTIASVILLSILGEISRTNLFVKMSFIVPLKIRS